jgi:magnesium transporter
MATDATGGPAPADDVDAVGEAVTDVATAPDPAAALMDLPPGARRGVFFRLSEPTRAAVVSGLSADDLFAFVRRLDPDEATDVLGFADEERRETALERLDERRREGVAFLLEFSPESAAGVMHLDYVTVRADDPLSAVAERVRRHEGRTGRFPTVFVVDDGDLVGELPGHALALDENGDVAGDHVVPATAVRYDRPDEAVLDVFRSNPESTVAVLGADDEIVGVIDAEDLLRGVEEEAGETLYEFTGVREGESVLDGPAEKVRRRYRWLIVNLGTAFLAAATVGLFEDTIAALAILAAYMPIVAGMGGNAGTQSMAVTVRGISLDEVSLSTGGRVIVNEVLAGAVNGAITGALVAVIATVVNQSPLLGLVLGVSMVANLIIAGFFGALIPLVLDRRGYDPATSATIFITTATDVLGFFVFLGLAQVVLL